MPLRARSRLLLVQRARLTLTNLTTGHVYRLESLSQDYPS